MELSKEEKRQRQKQRTEQARQLMVSVSQIFESGQVPAGVLQGVCIAVESLLTEEEP